MLHYTLMT